MNWRLPLVILEVKKFLPKKRYPTVRNVVDKSRMVNPKSRILLTTFGQTLKYTS